MSGADRFEAFDEHGGDREHTGCDGGEGTGAEQPGGFDGSGDPCDSGGPCGPGRVGGPGDPGDFGDAGGSGGSGDRGGSGGPRSGGPEGGGGSEPGRPRIPLPRASVEDGGRPLPALEDLGDPDRPAPPALDHRVLKSLLGAWALAACSAEEAAGVEEHLGECGACAEEALRLRDAVGLLQRPESLDLNPALRTRVLEACLERRPPRIPVPQWATAYDAETARLDALLQDFGDAEWHAPVRLRWFAGQEETNRRTTVAGVIAHLMTVDGLVAVALGLDDPLGEIAAEAGTPAARTEAYWRALHVPPTRGVRAQWREQSHDLVRTVAFTDGSAGRMPVSFGDFRLPLHDAMLDRAFECWVHAEDIADAVDYPYEPPSARHLNRMIDLAARLLPEALADRRRGGPGPSGGHRHLVAAGEPGRSLRLEIEGSGGGEWLIPLDSPAAVGSAEHEVAHIALDGVEFCRLAAGHVSPEEAAAGQLGDKQAIRDVLFAAASLSRM
ncbi:maleylpyruvate isomerase N-terminal domain-containing protein [Streptomyces sp. DH24]|uniref:maleylpyruvate isomerase N-terminal domain-containing protein n=1 Tax=Streptomyces sp. DH24 TaxID=3040123 RepID=UPI0024430D3D|nr:maleylpyruvate isomerase N-terminal domain-containing protein [Streptomyces sp. DH24]MDG9719297.1 maleylpyruvate isomerase N-terminal domain-containing protein [Streptomyces sp. DH24]